MTDERFSLVEIVVQCVEDLCPDEGPAEQLPEWPTVAALLRANPRLHASTICYGSLFGHDNPEEQFRVSVQMRRVGADVQEAEKLEGEGVALYRQAKFPEAIERL